MTRCTPRVVLRPQFVDAAISANHLRHGRFGRFLYAHSAVARTTTTLVAAMPARAAFDTLRAFE
ncbi:unnamed protein product [Trichogramma brassicae]|uniref:Uncharacterized protein n=1 Tax=Trichogramma brassicae TaxID=86971 RepID=A0A6H5HXR4_9HYME|nr:unnamed protein product [Trichogramma brassicae]